MAGLATDALPWDPAVRAEVERRLEAEGLVAIAAELSVVAPTLAARTDLHNPRRVVRALEIARLQGDRPLPAPAGYPAEVLGLQLVIEPVEHRGRIARRAREQFDAGLVDEARALRERYDTGLPAFSAIGYRESWAYLDGEVTWEQAIELDARRNVAFAKRQRTWFRAERSLELLDASSDPLGAARVRLNAFMDRATR
jgi:tRNA dimethylallyltransferase